MFQFTVDTPDPQFEVICPQVTQPKLRSFKTQDIQDDVTKGVINEEFKFVLPEDHEGPSQIIVRMNILFV